MDNALNNVDSECYLPQTDHAITSENGANLNEPESRGISADSNTSSGNGSPVISINNNQVTYNNIMSVLRVSPPPPLEIQESSNHVSVSIPRDSFPMHSSKLQGLYQQQQSLSPYATTSFDHLKISHSPFQKSENTFDSSYHFIPSQRALKSRISKVSLCNPTATTSAASPTSYLQHNSSFNNTGNSSIDHNHSLDVLSQKVSSDVQNDDEQEEDGDLSSLPLLSQSARNVSPFLQTVVSNSMNNTVVKGNDDNPSQNGSSHESLHDSRGFIALVENHISSSVFTHDQTGRPSCFNKHAFSNNPSLFRSQDHTSESSSDGRHFNSPCLNLSCNPSTCHDVKCDYTQKNIKSDSIKNSKNMNNYDHHLLHEEVATPPPTFQTHLCEEQSSLCREHPANDCFVTASQERITWPRFDSQPLSPSASTFLNNNHKNGNNISEEIQKHQEEIQIDGNRSFASKYSHHSCSIFSPPLLFSPSSKSPRTLQEFPRKESSPQQRNGQGDETPFSSVPDTNKQSNCGSKGSAALQTCEHNANLTVFNSWNTLIHHEINDDFGAFEHSKQPTWVSSLGGDGLVAINPQNMNFELSNLTGNIPKGKNIYSVDDCDSQMKFKNNRQNKRLNDDCNKVFTHPRVPTANSPFFYFSKHDPYSFTIFNDPLAKIGVRRSFSLPQVVCRDLANDDEFSIHCLAKEETLKRGENPSRFECFESLEIHNNNNKHDNKRNNETNFVPTNITTNNAIIISSSTNNNDMVNNNNNDNSNSKYNDYGGCSDSVVAVVDPFAAIVKSSFSSFSPNQGERHIQKSSFSLEDVIINRNKNINYDDNYNAVSNNNLHTSSNSSYNVDDTFAVESPLSAQLSSKKIEKENMNSNNEKIEEKKYSLLRNPKQTYTPENPPSQRSERVRGFQSKSFLSHFPRAKSEEQSQFLNGFFESYLLHDDDDDDDNVVNHPEKTRRQERNNNANSNCNNKLCDNDNNDNNNTHYLNNNMGKNNNHTSSPVVPLSASLHQPPLLSTNNKKAIEDNLDLNRYQNHSNHHHHSIPTATAAAPNNHHNHQHNYNNKLTNANMNPNVVLSPKCDDHLETAEDCQRDSAASMEDVHHQFEHFLRVFLGKLPSNSSCDYSGSPSASCAFSSPMFYQQLQQECEFLSEGFLSSPFLNPSDSATLMQIMMMMMLKKIQGTPAVERFEEHSQLAFTPKQQHPQTHQNLRHSVNSTNVYRNFLCHSHSSPVLDDKQEMPMISNKRSKNASSDNQNNNSDNNNHTNNDQHKNNNLRNSQLCNSKQISSFFPLSPFTPCPLSPSPPCLTPLFHSQPHSRRESVFRESTIFDDGTRSQMSYLKPPSCAHRGYGKVNEELLAMHADPCVLAGDETERLSTSEKFTPRSTRNRFFDFNNVSSAHNPHQPHSSYAAARMQVLPHQTFLRRSAEFAEGDSRYAMSHLSSPNFSCCGCCCCNCSTPMEKILDESLSPQQQQQQHHFNNNNNNNNSNAPMNNSSITSNNSNPAQHSHAFNSSCARQSPHLLRDASSHQPSPKRHLSHCPLHPQHHLHQITTNTNRDNLQSLPDVHQHHNNHTPNNSNSNPAVMRRSSALSACSSLKSLFLPPSPVPVTPNASRLLQSPAPPFTKGNRHYEELHSNADPLFAVNNPNNNTSNGSAAQNRQHHHIGFDSTFMTVPQAKMMTSGTPNCLSALRTSNRRPSASPSCASSDKLPPPLQSEGLVDFHLPAALPLSVAFPFDNDHEEENAVFVQRRGGQEEENRLEMDQSVSQQSSILNPARKNKKLVFPTCTHRVSFIADYSDQTDESDLTDRLPNQSVTCSFLVPSPCTPSTSQQHQSLGAFDHVEPTIVTTRMLPADEGDNHIRHHSFLTLPSSDVLASDISRLRRKRNNFYVQMEQRQQKVKIRGEEVEEKGERREEKEEDDDDDDDDTFFVFGPENSKEDEQEEDCNYVIDVLQNNTTK